MPLSPGRIAESSALLDRWRPTDERAELLSQAYAHYDANKASHLTREGLRGAAKGVGAGLLLSHAAKKVIKSERARAERNILSAYKNIAALGINMSKHDPISNFLNAQRELNQARTGLYVLPREYRFAEGRVLQERAKHIARSVDTPAEAAIRRFGQARTPEVDNFVRNYARGLAESSQRVIQENLEARPRMDRIGRALQRHRRPIIGGAAAISGISAALGAWNKLKKRRSKSEEDLANYLISRDEQTLDRRNAPKLTNSQLNKLLLAMTGME